MEISWVEDFLSLADARSFSRAAGKRHLSQPALSRRIQALEGWLGVELVDRSSNPLTLTASGRAFRTFAEGFVRQLYQARGVLQKNQNPTGRKVRFAISYALSLSFFPNWFAKVSKVLGESIVEVNELNVMEGVASLAAGEVDFLVCHHHPRLPMLGDLEKYPSTVLDSETILPYSACDDKGNPIYRLPGSAAHPVPYLMYAQRTFFVHVVNMILLNSGQPYYLSPCYQGQMSEALKVMAVGGNGVAWLPEKCVVKELHEQKLAPAGASKWGTQLEVRIFRSTETRTPAVDALWEHLQDPNRG